MCAVSVAVWSAAVLLVSAAVAVSGGAGGSKPAAAAVAPGSRRLLVVSSPVGVSHALHMRQVSQILADAGHRVTYLRNSITGSTSGPRPESSADPGDNPRQIVIRDEAGEGILQMMHRAGRLDPVFNLWNQSNVEHLSTLRDAFRVVCEGMLRERGVWERLGAEQYDAVVIDEFASYCVLGYIEHYLGGTPIILYHTSRLISSSAYLLNVPYPVSYAQTTLVVLPVDMTNPSILDRAKNLVNYAAETLLLGPLGPMGIGQAVLDDHLSAAPDVTGIVSRASLVAVHSDWSYEKAKPIVPNLVMVGGILCRDPKPLPKDIEALVSSRAAGFIYMSFGTATDSSLIGRGIIDMFVDAFSHPSLSQYTILWKLDIKPDWRQLPGNLHVLQWLPQQDLLGHKNMKLFISHGGLNSMYETIYHAAPTLVIPISSDQPSNAQALSATGMALTLGDKNNLDSGKVVNAMVTILNDKSFKVAAEERSAILRDHPQSARDRFVYWVEYVVRHGGAEHLRIDTHGLNLLQYFNLDIFALLLTLAALTVYCGVRVVAACCCRRVGARGAGPAVSDSKKTS